MKPVKLRLVHACVGLLVVVLASATQVAAFYSQWFNNSISSSGLNKLLISLIPISQAFIIMNQVTNRYLLPNFNYYQKSTLFQFFRDEALIKMVVHMTFIEKFHLCSTIALLVIGVCIAILSKPGSSLFSWHPFCMSVSFLMLIQCVQKCFFFSNYFFHNF